MRELKRYTMNYGLYTGAAFVAVIMLFHFIGYTHFPGDRSSMINAMVLAFMMFYAGRKYKYEVAEGHLTLGTAYRFTLMVGLFSTFILAAFSYLYFDFIASDGIAHFIQQMEVSLTEAGSMTEEQRQVFLDLYRQNLTAGSMAFVALIMQSFTALIVGFFVAIFIRTPQLQNFNK